MEMSKEELKREKRKEKEVRINKCKKKGAGERKI
jgi:hypothetical protein